VCAADAGNCCLLNTDAGIWGYCMSQADCNTMGGGFVACGNTPDTLDCPAGSTTCCVSVSDSGGLPGSYCAASCPSGTPYACNGGGSTCPSPGNWNCSPIPGSIVPTAALGECTAVPEGGTEAGPDDAGDGGTVQDAGGQ
jgi:hypothetical protein